jgi:hypothetical protein
VRHAAAAPVPVVPGAGSSQIACPPTTKAVRLMAAAEKRNRALPPLLHQALAAVASTAPTSTEDETEEGEE